MHCRLIAVLTLGWLMLIAGVIPVNAAPLVKESLFRDGWTLNVGPGAAGKLEIGDGRIRVDADFHEGGYYIAVERKLPVPINLDGLHFTVKGISGRIAVNLFDSRWQIHQHFLDVSAANGGAASVSLPVTAAKHHWGGPNDGKLVPPIRQYSFVIHRTDLGSAQKTVEFSNISMETDDPHCNVLEWSIPEPEALFRHIGDRTPVTVNVSSSVTARGPDVLRFSYRDYAGVERLTGMVQYDRKNEQLIVPPPPGNGFYELSFPKLNIQIGIVTDEPAPRQPDEFFGVDGSFSWGGPPADEKGIRRYLRILKKTVSCGTGTGFSGRSWSRNRGNSASIIGMVFTTVLPARRESGRLTRSTVLPDGLVPASPAGPMELAAILIRIISFWQVGAWPALPMNGNGPSADLKSGMNLTSASAVISLRNM